MNHPELPSIAALQMAAVGDRTGAFEVGKRGGFVITFDLCELDLIGLKRQLKSSIVLVRLAV